MFTILFILFFLFNIRSSTKYATNKTKKRKIKKKNYSSNNEINSLKQKSVHQSLSTYNRLGNAYRVQGHPRSSILVPIESAYALSY